MGSLSIGHWLIVVAIVAMVFGTKKLRTIGSDIGGAVKGFKAGLKDADGPEGEVATAVSRGATVDVEARQTVTSH
ncbi:MAG: sec-independent protein translocase protein TatA [Paraburkholderia sp.]|jgi:sec-independent protein translocase protein TatA|nr:sec-independent protein translocase protein TatA [Paraburkholderia sp.]MEA3122302.1 sec-independent protein translocase protein TatA [Paraburkholderia sp.]